MKKIKQLISLIALSFSIAMLNTGTVAAQTTVTITTGGISTPVYAVGPVYMSSTLFYRYSRFAYLYTQSELQAVGITPGTNILSVGWMKSTSNATNSGASFKLYMKNSSVADYALPSETWANLSIGATLVYDNNTQIIPATATPNYIDFTLDNGFIYTGGSLEILAEWDISMAQAPIATGPFEWENTMVANRIYASGSNSMPATLSSTSNNVSITGKRPKIQFTIGSLAPCTSPITAGNAVVSPITPVCVGDSVTLSVNGNSSGSGITFEWERSIINASTGFVSISTAQTSSGLTAQNNNTSWYRAKVVCSGGTPAYTPAVQVTADVVNVNLGNDTVICDGVGSITLNAGNPGSTYMWSNGTNAQTINVTTPGTYSVTVTNSNGCIGSDNINITAVSTPTGDFTYTEMANGTVDFVATANNTATYLWDFGNNNATAIGNPISYTYPANGDYGVVLFLVNECADSIPIPKTVSVRNIPVGISAIDNLEKVYVYPNPSTGILNIENANKIHFEKIQLVDILGHIVYRQSYKSAQAHYTLNIENLSSGIYFLVLHNAENKHYQKVIIK
ncbi:MAG TPA: T9SS type A sorting domain-containing protein [Edaphocola sp.]|nr:T9SS type A sorting domain-containing protein [Edaphocola sp.]